MNSDLTSITMSKSKIEDNSSIGNKGVGSISCRITAISKLKTQGNPRKSSPSW